MVGPSDIDLANLRHLELRSKLTYQTELAEDYRIARNVWRAMFLVLWAAMLFIIFGGLLRW